MNAKYDPWIVFIGRGLLILLISVMMLVSLQIPVAASAVNQTSSEGEALFNQRCVACHSIGGGVIVGPDLAGVMERRNRAWVAEFIRAPDQMLISGDPIATELLGEFNNLPMPNLALSADQVESLLAFFESGASVIQTSGPLPAGDANRGQSIFVSGYALENNGTPCISCHSVGAVGAFGGGILGPDLTHVFQRYGETGLASAMQNIAFPTMQGIYANKPLTNQEVADLLSFFTNANAIGGENTALSFTPIFWGAGVFGAVLLFGVMAIFWPRQRQSLSDRLRKSAGITSRRNS